MKANLASFFTACSLLSAHTVTAEEVTLFCVTKHTIGMVEAEGTQRPSYSTDRLENRYTVRVNENFSQIVGVEGTNTPYHCRKMFPTKAPDVVTCINSRVATMAFNYSTKSGNFILTMVSPGGWLSKGTDRADDDLALSDHLVMGTCQSF